MANQLSPETLKIDIGDQKPAENFECNYYGHLWEPSFDIGYVKCNRCQLQKRMLKIERDPMAKFFKSSVLRELNNHAIR